MSISARLLTLGRLTLGTMTSLRAEGASLRGLLVLGITAGLPGLRVDSNGDGVLGRGGSGVAREMPASETEGTGHDGEQDLFVCETMSVNVVFVACHLGWVACGTPAMEV
jgi:hypothetical protein